MQMSKTEDEFRKKSKCRTYVIADAGTSEGVCDSANGLVTQQEVINDESKPDEPATRSKILKGSPELTRRRSRTEAVRQDAIKLKSVTLGRMGKMFRQRSQTPVTDKSSASVAGITVCGEQPSRKEKTNSLGRMLKLVEKDGSPRKLFNHARTGSLNRILRRQSHNDGEVADRTVDEPGPGIFSRMLNQLRGRPPSGNPTAEPNIKTRNKMSSLPPKVPLNSRTGNDSSSLSSPLSSPVQPSRSSQKSTNLEYST